MTIFCQNIAITFQNQLRYPWIEIFNSHDEKKDGMKNYGFIAIYFYGNMFLSKYGL